MFQKYKSQLLTAGLVVALGIGLLFFQDEVKSMLAFIQSERTPPSVIILSFLVLPMVFFPVTALLVLIGIRFDVVSGLLIMFLLMAVHLLIAFSVTRSIFHGPVKRFATKKGCPIIDIPAERYREFGFLFMAVPGLPYSVKNYLLPVSGIPFREYFFISWPVNGVMGIPFVVLGDAASRWSIPLFFIFLVLFLIACFIARKLRSKYDRLLRPDSGK